MSIPQGWSVADLRTAASAWRRHDKAAVEYRQADWWYKWVLSKPDMSLHDRIDDLIDEIERLRETEK